MSPNGAITLSAIVFLTFLGRALMDWRYEYPYQDPAGNWDMPGDDCGGYWRQCVAAAVD